MKITILCTVMISVGSGLMSRAVATPGHGLNALTKTRAREAGEVASLCDSVLLTMSARNHDLAYGPRRGCCEGFYRMGLSSHGSLLRITGLMPVTGDANPLQREVTLAV